MKLLLLLPSLLLTSVCIAQTAGPQADLPMSLSESLRGQLPEVSSIVGVYATDTESQAKDLRALRDSDSALDDQLLALVADLPQGQLHFSNSGIDIALEESSLVALRNGKHLNLENACADWSKPGDQLVASYEGAGWSAHLEARVQSHVPFVQSNGAPKAVTPGDSRTCAAESGAQTYYTGIMSIRFDGKVLRQSPVVVYNMQIP